jgi:hypothetical protein
MARSGSFQDSRESDGHAGSWDVRKKAIVVQYVDDPNWVINIFLSLEDLAWQTPSSRTTHL